MYKLNFTPEFQAETGYWQDCNLLFEDFLDAIKHVRDVVMEQYPKFNRISFHGFVDDHGNFNITIPTNCHAGFKTPPIATITLK